MTIYGKKFWNLKLNFVKFCGIKLNLFNVIKLGQIGFFKNLIWIKSVRGRYEIVFGMNGDGWRYERRETMQAVGNWRNPPAKVSSAAASGASSAQPGSDLDVSSGFFLRLGGTVKHCFAWKMGNKYFFFKFFKKWKESDDAGCFSSGGNGRQVAPFTCHMIRSHTLHMPVRYICQDYHLWEHIFHLKANNELVSGKVPPGGLATKNKFPPKLLYLTNLDVSLKLLVVNSSKLAGMFFIIVSLTGKNCTFTV